MANQDIIILFLWHPRLDYSSLQSTAAAKEPYSASPCKLPLLLLYQGWCCWIIWLQNEGAQKWVATVVEKESNTNPSWENTRQEESAKMREGMIMRSLTIPGCQKQQKRRVRGRHNPSEAGCHLRIDQEKRRKQLPCSMEWRSSISAGLFQHVFKRLYCVICSLCL